MFSHSESPDRDDQSVPFPGTEHRSHLHPIIQHFPSNLSNPSYSPRILHGYKPNRLSSLDFQSLISNPRIL
jgi:hypothetical protein